MAKIRLDSLLFVQGLVESREKARAVIIAGEVRVNGAPMDKPGTKVDEHVELIVVPRKAKYVSRGGFKMEAAIHDFAIDFREKVVLDVGASTGGYTDCALQNGAVKVFALDVGYGQLDWGLRNDARVVVMERTNIRYITLEELGEQVDIITVDVAFISTRLIYPVLTQLLKDDGEIVCLIKPQFEAGRDKVGKRGVVKDPAVHCDVLRQCIKAAGEVGLNCRGITYSPIKGPQGNIEYFIHLKKQLEPLEHTEAVINEVVRKAHSILEGKKQ
ncbi:MAG: TlyA family RNA methyltransferase [Firmicutes bacterium]|nr:TlyA family RNA methyltransferase [Bacillota bacterium]